MTDRPALARELHAAIERGAQVVAGQQETFRQDDLHPGNVVRSGSSAAVGDLIWAGRGDPGRDVVEGRARRFIAEALADATTSGAL